MFEGLLPESQAQNLALTVSYVPSSLVSGMPDWCHSTTPRLISLLDRAGFAPASSPSRPCVRRGLGQFGVVEAHSLAPPLPSEKGTTSKGLGTFE